MSTEITKSGPSPLVRRILLWDWEKIALAGIITLALANVLLFVRERKGVK